MIAVEQIGQSNIVEVIVKGDCTSSDLDQVARRLNDIIAQQGTICVLENDRATGVVTPMSILLDESRFDFKNRACITHVALVTDQLWLGVFSSSLSKMLAAEVLCFTRLELKQAKAWLKKKSKNSRSKLLST
ncbi:MAG: STAS/SEC14 domain-containing protein [Planctomycetales bacterium]|nr:STAS/SEC14 domain-containing protein [Planctomycetales bacterium]